MSKTTSKQKDGAAVRSTALLCVQVTRKEFNSLPMAMRRRELKRQTDRMLLRSALDTLALALSNHGHTWTPYERELYERAIA